MVLSTQEQIVGKLRKVATCIYIATEESVARDVSETCLAAAAEIAQLRDALERIRESSGDPVIERICDRALAGQGAATGEGE